MAPHSSKFWDAPDGSVPCGGREPIFPLEFSRTGTNMTIMIGFVMPESTKPQYWCLRADKEDLKHLPSELSDNDLHERCNWNRIIDEPVEFWSILTLVAAPPVTETQSVHHTACVPVTKTHIHTSVQPPALQEQPFFCGHVYADSAHPPLSWCKTGQLIWLFGCAGLDLFQSFVTEGRIASCGDGIALLDRPVRFYSSPNSEVTFWFSCLKWSSLSEKSIQELR